MYALVFDSRHLRFAPLQPSALLQSLPSVKFDLRPCPQASAVVKNPSFQNLKFELLNLPVSTLRLIPFSADVSRPRNILSNPPLSVAKLLPS